MHQRIPISTEENLIYVSATKIENGFLTTLHSHPNLELLLVTEGVGHIISTNRKIEVKAHDIVVINPNSMHCEIGEGLTFFALGVTNLDLYVKDSFQKKIIVRELNSGLYKDLKTIYEWIMKEALLSDSESSNLLHNMYQMLFSILERNFHISINDTKEDKDSDLISNIKMVIDTYYTQEIKLDDLAHRFSLSKSSLCHTFKKETGSSIIEYKIKKQLDEGKNLLLMSDMSVSDISSLVGFNDSSYFIKLFKKQYGVTPKEYQEKNKC